jgi:hypothetical protein
MRSGSVSQSLLTRGLVATKLGACTTTGTRPQLLPAAFVANQELPGEEYVIGPLDQLNIFVWRNPIGNTMTASASVRPGAIAPFGITLSGAYDRETASQLKQRYEGYYGRGDILQPISPYVALTAGVGYEKIETSQKDAVVDATVITLVALLQLAGGLALIAA